MNFAAVFQTPTIFVCQNNQWAISIPRSRQTRSRTIAQKALAYGMPGIQVDGNDILAVYAAATEAVARARSGEGPTLIEAVTYRMSVHTTADDPKRYRNDDDVAPWRAKDPITRLQTYLADRGLITEAADAKLRKEIDDQIQSAIDRAEVMMAGMGNPLDMFDHLYADLHPELTAQRGVLSKLLTDVDRND
jgi:pyruvate dehydrogenase E1 component alpha subunit